MDLKIIDFQDRLFRCSTFEECWQLYLDELTEYGIQHVLYGYALFHNDATHFANQFHCVTNHPQTFQEDYEEVGGAERDALVAYVANEDIPLEWSTSGGLAKVTPEQQAVEDVSMDHGVVYGYSIPFSMAGSNKGGVGLSATGVQKREFKRDIVPYLGYFTVITSLFHVAAQRYPRMMSTHLGVGHDAELTEKEREVIKWLAHGYRIQEIAEKKMFRSQESVNLYIRHAKKKLVAPNTAQLVAKAMIFSLI